MNLVADEGIDHAVVEHLRAAGHAVAFVAETAPGSVDDTILFRANRDQALLITADKDFGELVFRLRQATAGVVLLHLGGLSQGKKAELVAAALDVHGDELFGAFTVIDPGSIRIRRDLR